MLACTGHLTALSASVSAEFNIAWLVQTRAMLRMGMPERKELDVCGHFHW